VRVSGHEVGPLVLEIPVPTPSLNVMLAGGWRKRHFVLRSRWRDLVGCALGKAVARRMVAVVPVATGPTEVRVSRYGRALLDRDNLVGGTKALVDALRHYRLIVDDSPAHLALHVEQQTGRPWRTRVEIAPHGTTTGK